jgi:hypothetical protein
VRVLVAARRVGFLGLGLLTLAFLVGVAQAEDDEDVILAARAYLDPAQEFLWRPRKQLVAALAEWKERTGVDALVDIPRLREIVYQGRHFLPRLSDKKWQRDNEVVAFETTDGLYVNVMSVGQRFTYVLPEKYPDASALGKIPRPAPWPLLLAIHEEQDGKDEEMKAEKYPGGAVLRRRFPKGEFDALYENWLVLAPAAARARFLDDDGAIRHRYLTGVLTDFWRRYHVDFDRIVVDGGAPAAALAAAFPHVFAGLVLRPGRPIDLDVVGNYASVPVFVVGDDELARELEQAGHSDVSVGDDEALLAWLKERRRRTVTRFRWRYKRPDHTSAHWIVVTGPVPAAPRLALQVEVLDTEADPNTIRLDAQGIERVRMFLNDQIVDLDRPVRLVVNGDLRELGTIERDFGRLFEKDPEVRRNMNFGWLYTTVLEDVAVTGDAPLPPLPTPPDEPEPVPPESRPTLAERLAAQQEWLEGRPDRLEQHLGTVADGVEARALLPFALRDLWWRPTGDEALGARCRDVAADTEDPVLADQLRWVLAGGGDPYPTYGVAAWDPWPVLTALVLERQQREAVGARWLPDESPVLRRRVLDAPVAWQDWYARWCAWFYDEVMRTAYEGEDPERVPEAYREADRAQARLAEDVGDRNAWLALLAGLLIAGGAFVLGRRASRA